MSRLLVLLSTFQLISCIDAQFNNDYPTLDLDFINGALLQQHQEMCHFEWLTLEKRIDTLRSLLFGAPLVYSNKSYVISKFPHKNSGEAMKYCQAFGGYLAEVDDYSEFNELKDFFLRSSVKEMVLIAGSDELKEGTWTFQRTGVALPFERWAPEEPNNKAQIEHCLCLWKDYIGKMNDITCSFRNDMARFMCELPGST
ncbi:C-type lectin 37Db-like [Biomphalaria glabrata]|uniref:C-type lectin 37Db-like n=1 Tax=Biomphalaria glabrata TaxID=6526 RepID=A0A9W2YAK1_BIOGL|nr:C-type lectin 37Db-like [Biomphalaria glabrata]